MTHSETIQEIAKALSAAQAAGWIVVTPAEWQAAIASEEIPEGRSLAHHQRTNFHE